MPSHQMRREPLPRSYRYGDAARMGRRQGAVHERWIVEEERRIVTMLRDKRRLAVDDRS